MSTGNLAKAQLLFKAAQQDQPQTVAQAIATAMANSTSDGASDPRWVEELVDIRSGVPFAKAMQTSCVHQEDSILPYVRDLKNVVDMEAIRGAGLKLGVDPLGGAARPYWKPINSIYGLDIAVANPVIHPALPFMTIDHNAQTRMDCSSPYTMASLAGLKGFVVAKYHHELSDKGSSGKGGWSPTRAAI